jgi:hypothetical protein
LFDNNDFVAAEGKLNNLAEVQPLHFAVVFWLAAKTTAHETHLA